MSTTPYADLLAYAATPGADVDTLTAMQEAMEDDEPTASVDDYPGTNPEDIEAANADRATSQHTMYRPLPIRYLTLLGDKVFAFDTYVEAETFVTTYRTNQTAVIQTQIEHADGWQTHATRTWSGTF